MQFPIRHKNHTLEQKSETFIRKHLPQDWTVSKPTNDYGQDLNIEICEENQYKGLDLIIQLKSSLANDILGNQERQQLRVSTYNYLIGNLRTAMLIKYIENENEAYWILLKDINPPKSDTEQESFTVHIPRENRISNINWTEITKYVRSMTDDKLKISRLADNLEKVKQELQETKLSFIRQGEILTQLNANLKISFSGEWDSDPYPSHVISPVSDQWYMTFVSRKGNLEIRFYALETFRFQTISKGNGVFACKMAISPGDFPLGESQNALTDYQVIYIFIPFILYQEIKNSKIKIDKVDIDLIFNGKLKKTVSITESWEVEVKLHNNNKANAWATLTLCSDEANANILSYFNVD